VLSGARGIGHCGQAEGLCRTGDGVKPAVQRPKIRGIALPGGERGSERLERIEARRELGSVFDSERGERSGKLIGVAHARSLAQSLRIGPPSFGPWPASAGPSTVRTALMSTSMSNGLVT